jgi:hypothetical protein
MKPTLGQVCSVTAQCLATVGVLIARVPCCFDDMTSLQHNGTSAA